MSTTDYNEYKAAAALGLIPENENPVYLFNSTSKDILLDLINGKIDAVELARIELSNRGLDETGQFIGWNKNAHNEFI